MAERIDPERLARAIHETKNEHLEKRDAEARAAGRLIASSITPPFKGRPFDELPESSRENLLRDAAAAVERYYELGRRDG